MGEGEARKADSEQAKIEYDRLTSFLKYLVTIVALAITVIFSVAGYLTGKSVTDIKAEANSAIAAATQKAGAQLEKVREEARDIALGEARKRVDAAFEQANLTAMVEDAAQRKVGAVIDRQIKQEVARSLIHLQTEMDEIGKVANFAMQARVGKRGALESLAEMAREAETERGRQAANFMRESIIADYREAYAPIFEIRLENVPPQSVDVQRVSYVVERIRTCQNLNELTVYFEELARITGTRFEFLDFEAVEKWCKAQKHRCKQ